MKTVYAELTEDGTAVNVYNGGSLKDTYPLGLLGLELGVNPGVVKTRAVSEYYSRMSRAPELHLSTVWG